MWLFTSLRVAFFGVLCLPLFCQTVPQLSLESTTSSPGGSLPLAVLLQTASAPISGLQFDVSYDASILTMSVTSGPPIQEAAKSLYVASVSSGRARILVAGINQTIISSGAVVNLFLSVARSAEAGDYQITIDNVVAVDPAGNSIPISGAGAALLLPAPLIFVPMPPCRIADTRNAPGPFGGPSIPGGSSRLFDVPTGPCTGIPATSQAYSLNVTAVPQGQLGSLTVWPAGLSRPSVSTLNSTDGRVKANAAIMPTGQDGAISVYATNTTDVVLDINGYFVPSGATGGLAFYPALCRLVDTRSTPGPLAGPTLAAGVSRTFPLASSACGVPEQAQAYSLNFTALPQGPLGYITTWPTGASQPLVSTLTAPTARKLRTQPSCPQAAADRSTCSQPITPIWWST